MRKIKKKTSGWVPETSQQHHWRREGWRQQVLPPLVEVSGYGVRQGEVTPSIDSVQNLLGQELGQAVKAENLESQAVKQIRKSQGSSTVKGQPDTKSHQSTIPHLVEQVRSRVKGLFEWRSSGQGPNSRSNFFDAVAGVSTESIGVTSPCKSWASGISLSNLKGSPTRDIGGRIDDESAAQNAHTIFFRTSRLALVKSM